MKNKHWLAIIFILAFATRLIAAFMTPNFTYDSYFHLRHIEHIAEKGTPLYDDPLSYGGRSIKYLPLFHYVLAVPSTIIPLEIVAKVLPNLFIASMTLIAYAIARRITKNEKAPLFSALIAGFVPALFAPNQISPNSLFIPLIFLTLWAFVSIQKKGFTKWYILFFLLACLTSSAAILLVIGLFIYLLLARVEGKRVLGKETEIALFSTFFFVWIQFIFFKESLLTQGISFIWQNIPPQIISQYFPTPSIFDAMILVSVIPFLVGTYVVYKSLFELKNTKSFILISLVISTTILAWARWIQFKLSLAFFSVVLAVLFAQFYEELFEYLRQTKIESFKKYLAPLTIFLLFITMSIPLTSAILEQDIPSQKDIDAFEWLGKKVPEQAKVLSLLEEGNLVTYVSNKKNVMDDHFTLIDDTYQRFRDVTNLYTTPFSTQGLELLSRYDITHIIVSTKAQEKYDIENIAYFDRECFQTIHSKEVKILRVKCELAQT